MDKSIIIIGGGLTGLAAGCYGRMNGYHTSIFELHNAIGAHSRAAALLIWLYRLDRGAYKTRTSKICRPLSSIEEYVSGATILSLG